MQNYNNKIKPETSFRYVLKAFLQISMNLLRVLILQDSNNEMSTFVSENKSKITEKS